MENIHGSIGYRKFEVLKGNRLFAVLRMADNSYPPFGASVMNAKGRDYWGKCLIFRNCPVPRRFC